jgi:flagellar protein FlaI
MNNESINTGLGYAENNKLFNDYYTVKPPFGNSGIYTDEERGNMEYVVFEPFLNQDENSILNEIKSKMIDKLDIPFEILKDEEKIVEYLKKIIINEFKNFEKRFSLESREKIEYYIMRDFLGYGAIDLLIHDDKIEDISCNGLNIPIYVWHREYESIPTNIIFKSEKELKSIIIRLAYKAGVQISVSNPIVEGTLPNGFRIHLTLNEVSTRGHTFTIRKFRKNPYTLIDLINLGTISIKLAAYLWCLIENERSIMISGSTGSGKTTLLNSICTFIRPEHKVVTIEDVRELTLHQNWIPMVTRTSFQPDLREITLFDLLKSALRQRPDFIVLGEVRGEEAYTLFQAIATGHGGICSIHSESVESTIKRLASRPLNIPNHIIPLMNVIVQIRRIIDGEKIERRVTEVAEIIGNDTDGSPILNKRFNWDQENKKFKFIEPSTKNDYLFEKISENNHISIKTLIEQFEKKQVILKWMTEVGVKSQEEVAEVVRSYYLNPNEIYQRAKLEA